MVIRASFVVVLALAIAALIAPAASAEVFTFDIPSMTSINTMDFGMSFSSVNSVQLSCSGNAHKGLYLDWNMDLQDSFPEIIINIWNSGGLNSTKKNSISSNGSFTNRIITMPSSANDVVMGGKCSLFLDYDEILPYGEAYEWSSHASLAYSSAKLIIDGTANTVPEPASIAALICGLAGIAIRRRK